MITNMSWDEAGIIPFKARAWLDLSRRRDEGEKIDDKDVKKHRNDVARLLQLLSPEATYDLPEAIKADMQTFIEALAGQEDFTPKQFGVAMTRDVVIDRLRRAYRLRDWGSIAPASARAPGNPP